MKDRKASLLVPLATLAGLGFTGGVMLIGTQANSDPVGRDYDIYSRALTIGLILMFVAAVWIAQRLRGSLLAGAKAATVVAVGFGMLVAGNVLEFWGSLATGTETEKTAERLGQDGAFWGSLAGWLIFLAGEIAALVALIVVARAAKRWGATRPQRWAIGGSGVLMSAATGLWAVGPLPAAIAGVGFAFGFLTLATAVEHADELAPAEPEAASATPAHA
jgi:hypothetical protein